MSSRQCYVTEAKLVPGMHFDFRAPGAAVTVALCGHWEHEPPCRWPHNSEIDTSLSPFTLRTVFVAKQAEENDLRGKIEAALRARTEWAVKAIYSSILTEKDAELGKRLTAHI